MKYWTLNSELLCFSRDHYLLLSITQFSWRRIVKRVPHFSPSRQSCKWVFSNIQRDVSVKRFGGISSDLSALTFHSDEVIWYVVFYIALCNHSHSLHTVSVFVWFLCTLWLSKVFYSHLFHLNQLTSGSGCQRELLHWEWTISYSNSQLWSTLFSHHFLWLGNLHFAL